jgi:hypothetical protein
MLIYEKEEKQKDEKKQTKNTTKFKQTRPSLPPSFLSQIK